MAADDNEKRILGSIKLAADDLSRLRRVDVYRVLSDALQQGLLREAAHYIGTARPEFVDEVISCVEDLNEVSWVSSSGNQVQSIN